MKERDKTTLMTRLVWLCVINMSVLIWACYAASWFAVPVEPLLIAGGAFWGGEMMLLMLKRLTKPKDESKKGREKA